MEKFRNILLAHNCYSTASPSGENRVFELEAELLESKGHNVVKYIKSNDQIGERILSTRIKYGILSLWNPYAYSQVRSILINDGIDILHAHNTFPQISPSIFFSSQGLCPSVLSLHNYRIYCPAAIPLRDGRSCTDCLTNKSALESIRHGCYKDSKTYTAPVAIMVNLHRLLRTWSNNVDAFIVFSDYQKHLMIEGGLPPDKIHIKPHFLPKPPKPVSWEMRENYCVFVGRLSKEKGVATLINAWHRWGRNAPELRIIGDGTLREWLESQSYGLPIRFIGHLNSFDTQKQIANARLLIFPSECIETFGLVLIEAFAHGTPVVVSDEGPLPSIVTNGNVGRVFKARDPDDLINIIQNLWSNPDQLKMMGAVSRVEFEEKYNQEENYNMLTEIYDFAAHSFKKKNS